VIEATPNYGSPLPPMKGGSEAPSAYVEAQQAKSKMIRKMLALGYDMGYGEPRSDAERHMERKRRCWVHVEQWCKSSHCKVKKTLKRMSVEELTQVLTQFQAVHKHFMNEYAKKG
jgi:hypothetical protein